MSSLLTNTSAMTALAALDQTNNNLNAVENQISTGLAISSAADNASYWSISQQMQSNVGALGAVSSALSESSSLVGTMTTALQQSISVVDVIKNDLIAAANPGTNLADVQTAIAAQQASLLSIGSSANFNGQNFLETTGGTISLVSSYDSANGVSFLSIDTSQTQLFNSSTAPTAGILGASGANFTSASILSMNVSTATAGDLANMLADVDKAISSLTTAASQLGATTNNIATQQTYISNLSSSLTTGVGSLVDADMNEASTRLAALQVQQQLGVQALSISDQNTQLILKLFQG